MVNLEYKKYSNVNFIMIHNVPLYRWYIVLNLMLFIIIVYYFQLLIAYLHSDLVILRIDETKAKERSENYL